MIYVCPQRRVDDTVAVNGAVHLVTLLSAGTPFERPACIPATNHLFLSMNDIAEERAGLVAPGRAHVEALLDFVMRWDRTAPLVISCFAGISRSPAAAFISVCALAPHVDEMELATNLRQLSPSATPNPLLVRHADDILGRNGRMIAAIAAIGRGADAFEGETFALAIDRD